MKQSIVLTIKTIPTVVMGTVFNALIGSPTMASTFSAEPIYKTIVTNEIQIPTTNSLTGFDLTDIYYPQSSNPNDTFPLAIMLQGALVDKTDYSSFASQVASYGFLVAVPNHRRIISDDIPPGLFPTQEVINDVLAFMEKQNLNNDSPLEGKIDVDNIGLLGHSFGGSVGLAGIQGNCLPVICTTEFSRPEAVKAGIFYGTRLGGQDQSSPVPPILNSKIPTGLIGGTLDGVISVNKVIETYEQIQDPPKIVVSVGGANHYGITNNDSFRDPTRSTLDQEIATETIARWSGLFLRAHILEDRQAFDYVYSIGDIEDENVTTVSVRVNVPEPSSTGFIFWLGTGVVISCIAKNKFNQEEHC